MEPPPLPSGSGRFRLRVQIYPPQEAYNLNTVPLRQFTIVKTPVLALPDLKLQELCDEVVQRFKAIYPSESLFAIDKPQDSYGSDLYLGDRVRDVFEDNEIFRVIKGATIRASVEPHRARSQSVQPNGVVQYGSVGVGKRGYGHSEAEDSLRAQKRQRIITTNDPDRPIRSRERETVEGEVQPPREHGREATVIQDSQETTTEDRARRGISQGITKYGRMDSTQTREGGSFDRRYPNPFVTSLAPVQRIPTPPSGSSSKDEAATSGSEVNLRPSRAISQSKRKLNLIEDFGEEDRGQSISTAVTTPLSALQQPNHQSPMFDNKKLRRPTLRAGKSNTEEQEVAKALPRQNVYEVIETDTERPSAKSATQNVLSKIGNSYKWKQRSSTTPNSEKSSPRQRRTTVTKEKDLQSAEDERLNHEDQQQKLEQERNRAATLAKQRAEKERSKLAFEAAERRRLEKEAEEKKKQDEAKLKNERVAAETRRQEALKAKEVAAQARAEAEAEATRKRNALAKAEADKTAQLMEKARLEEDEKARLEEQRKAMLEEERRAREASEADKLRLGIDALRKAEKENDLKEQALLQLRQENRQKSQNLKASLEATVRRAASTPAKAVTARDGHSATEATLEAGDIVPASTAGPAIISNKRVTCTPFIPRGRPSGLSPAALHSSEATTESLPRVSSPNVGLEDQMPMPPQLKRKVSFVDQVPPSRGRSSSVSSALRQTTLVPPSAVKSTLKRTPMKANSNGSKPSKGKAKVVESPGKPPSPTIEISSDEESSADSSRPDHQNVNSKVVGRPGPAYRKPVAKQVLSPPKSQSLTAVIELHGTAEHHRNVSKGEAENTSTENSTTPPKPSTNPTSPASQKKKIRSNSESAASHAPPSISPQATPQNMKVPQSQGGSSTQSHDSTNAAKSLALAGSQETESDHLETEGRSETTDDDLEEESDPTETPDAPEVANVPISVKSGQSDSTNLEEDRTEATDDEVEEESDSDEPHGGPQPSSAPASAMNEQDSSTHLKADTENETTDEELEEELDIRQADTEDETTDGELDEYSDAMQAQVDDQLLTQSFESSSSLKQQSRVSNVTKVPLPAVKDAGLLQNHGSGRPSLRRMNLEAQRTKEANLEAAKARGLEKAQKIRAGTKPAELLEENSEVASSSELSSTSSEYETDEDEPMVNARSKRSSADNAAESHSDLNNEDVEEMSQKLLAESDFNGPSFSRVSALKSLSKGPDRMFRPTSKLQQDGAKRDGKKSGKIGWAKLGRQFSASKHKSSG